MVTHDEWHKLANEKFKELKILDGPGYTVERKAAEGQRLIMRIPKQAEAKSGSSAYSGPFAVIKKDDTTVTVLTEDHNNGRYEQNLIECGDYRDEITEPVDITIGTLFLYYIYLHFFWDEDVKSYFWEYLALESEIVNSDGHYYELLAYVIRPNREAETPPPFEIVNMHWGVVKIVGKLVAYGYSAEA